MSKKLLKLKEKNIHVWMSPHEIRYIYKAISPPPVCQMSGVRSHFKKCNQTFLINNKSEEELNGKSGIAS